VFLFRHEFEKGQATMKLLPFFLATLFAFLTAPAQAQYPEAIRKITDTAWEAARQEDDHIEFVLPITTPPLSSTKGSLKGAAILHLTAPLGSTKGSLTGVAVLQFTPPIGSNKGSLTGDPGAQPSLPLGTATEPFVGLIEGVTECDDSGICRADMVLSATSYQHNQSDLEFLLTGQFDLTTREWFSLSLILPNLEQDN
jgi:hypothetical protein